MTETIKGSVVLITGAAGTIAKALIAELKSRGAAKILCGRAGYFRSHCVRRVGAAQDGCYQRRGGGGYATRVAGDVTLLINNACVNHNTAFLVAPDIAIAREEIEINYLAPLRVTKAFAPALIKNKGAVLNILTILARVNLPFMGSYCASKAACLSLTQGLRGELTPKGVRVASNCLAPSIPA